MSVDIHVEAFRPADEKWKKMKAIWDNCIEADVDIPEEVDKFFEGEDPEDKPGMSVSIKGAIRDYRDENCDGYEVDITKLPKDVTILRFLQCC